MLARIAVIATLVAASGNAATGAVVQVAKNGPITTLQAGIDAAAAGDTVLVKAGVYAGVATISSAKNGLILAAKGKVVLDVLGAGAAALGPGLTIDATDVRVIGFTIRNAKGLGGDQGDGIEIGAAGCRIEKCTLRACSNAGIRVLAAGATIRKCLFRSNGEGVSLNDADDTKIESCRFAEHDNDAVFALDSANVSITSCTVRGVAAGLGVESDGDCPNLLVRKCQFEGIPAAAIESESAGGVYDDLRVRDCGGGLLVSGNGLRVEDVTMERLRSNDDAVDVSTAIGATIVHLVVRDSPASVLVLQSTASDAVVTDVRATRCGGASRPALSIEGSGHDLDALDIRDAGSDGIAIDAVNVTLTKAKVLRAVRDGFDVDANAVGVRLVTCLAQFCAAEGIDNSGANTELASCVAKNNRLDAANDGSFAQFDITFTTGGENVAPEID